MADDEPEAVEIPLGVTTPLLNAIRAVLRLEESLTNPDGVADDVLTMVLTELYIPHLYFSTACLHKNHAHCNEAVNIQGQPKIPGKCKFCESRCVCPCHIN